MFILVLSGIVVAVAIIISAKQVSKIAHLQTLSDPVDLEEHSESNLSVPTQSTEPLPPILIPFLILGSDQVLLQQVLSKYATQTTYLLRISQAYSDTQWFIYLPSSAIQNIDQTAIVPFPDLISSLSIEPHQHSGHLHFNQQSAQNITMIKIITKGDHYEVNYQPYKQSHRYSEHLIYPEQAQYHHKTYIKKQSTMSDHSLAHQHIQTKNRKLVEKMGEALPIHSDSAL